MRRGDIVTVSVPGDFGKPRPAVIIQSDLLNDTHATVLVCLITSALSEPSVFRIQVEPQPGNGLRVPSQIMIDKVATLQRAKIGTVVGRLDSGMLTRLDRSLAFVVGIAA